MSVKRKYWAAMAMIVAGVLAIGGAFAVAAEPEKSDGGEGARARRGARGRTERRRGRGRRPALTKGIMAPDFDLPMLVEEKSKDGKKVNRISKKRIKLSSFRGKQLVCVFFSSYT